MTKNGLRARLTLAVFALSAAGLLLPGGCGSNDFLGLEDYQRDILVWLLRDGQAGGTGLQCWDLDGDGVADPAEDTNGDGVVNDRDCDGLSCWDLNGNGARDPDEDTNGDGNVDTGDCRGELCRVRLIFLLDTSGSMDDQAAAVCTAIETPIAGDGTEFVIVGTHVLGIDTDLPPGPSDEFTCLAPPPFDSVVNVAGLLDGVDADVDDEEDWGPATRVVVEAFDAIADLLELQTGEIRVIVPIFDEDPQQAGPGACPVCDDADRESVAATPTLASANNVLVFPILGTPPPEPTDPAECPVPDRDCIEDLVRDLAFDLRLRVFLGLDQSELQAIFREIINSACAGGS